MTEVTLKAKYGQRTLILGGARSGKSRYAEQLATELAQSTGRQVFVIATAQAGDAEMQARIALHRQQRPSGWITLEEPIALGQAIVQARQSPDQHSGNFSGAIILVDCLTVWLANLLFAEARDYPEIGHIEPPACFAVQRAHLLDVLAALVVPDEGRADGTACDILLVSNEVGSGIIPQGAISRWFVDEAGRLNQAVAALCDRAVLVVAGLPLVLKG